jgi:hypothetical protein
MASSSEAVPDGGLTGFTLLDGGRRREVGARISGRHVLVEPAALRAALGWEIHGQCVPVPEDVALTHPEGVDLAELARVLDRPLAVDLDEKAAALGVAAAERGRSLRSLQAPDFTLPDLEGRSHSLAEHRGRKIQLVAWASW